MVDLMELWVNNKVVENAPKQIEQTQTKTYEISPYQIHQLAINKQRIPNKDEYKRISEFNMLRDISSIPYGAIFSNYLNKVKLPIKVSFWYCRSKLWNIDKIVTLSVKKDKEKDEKIKLLQKHYECDYKLAELYLDEFISDEQFQEINNLYKEGINK